MDEDELLNLMLAHDVPLHLRPGIVFHVIHGCRVGGFLEAVLENNFVEAICAADGTQTKESLLRLAQFMYCELPSKCWGSQEKVIAWRKEHQS